MCMIQILVIMHYEYDCFPALFSPLHSVQRVMWTDPTFGREIISCLELPHRNSYEVPMRRILATFFLKLHKH